MEEVMKRRFAYFAALVMAILGVALITTAAPALADTFNFTSCHISTGCPAAGTVFGTVTLTQSGSNVTFDVVLLNGNTFVETGSGGGNLFDFNDTIAGSTVTNITTTIDGATVTVIPGGVSGATNLAPFMADGTGFFTAAIFCTVASDCNGGNIFVADILCGAAQTGCAGFTGPVDVSTPAVPEPTTLLLVGTALAGLGGVWRRSRSQRAKALAV
jgi:PEP-CTERM motif-containing protein